MGDIHEIRRPPPRIWVCDCGCSTFELWADGSSKCAACGSNHEGHGSGWLERSQDRESRHSDGDTFTDVQGNGSEEFARRRVARMAADDDAALVVLARNDGSVSVWSKAETKAQTKWARQRLKIAAKLVRRKVDHE